MAPLLASMQDTDDEPWQASLTQGVNYHAPSVGLSSGYGTGLLELP